MGNLYRYPVTVNHIPMLPQDAYRLGIGLFEFVTMHDTGTDGDTAIGEAQYEARNWNVPGKKAFVAEFCDPTRVQQVANPAYRQWGAGHTANSEAVHLELCHARTLAEFKQAYDRWVSRAALYLFARGLGVKDNVTLRSHREVSTDFHETDHQDPDGYLSRWGYTWKDVVESVTFYYSLLLTEAKSGHFGTLPGIPDQCITNPLIPGHNKVVRPVLRQGSNGYWVEIVQRELGLTGRQVDGAFGQITYRLVRAFQQAHGLHPVDGVVGADTWNALDDAKTPPAPKPATGVPETPKNATQRQPGPNPAISYAVQVGSFQDKTNADHLATELQNKGFKDAYVAKRED